MPFLLPALVLVFFFLIIPVIWTVLLSVNKTRGLNFGTEWVGLDNYERLLTRDSRFLDRDEFPWTGALINNIRWLIVYPILCLLLGLPHGRSGDAGSLRSGVQGDHLRADGDLRHRRRRDLAARLQP